MPENPSARAQGHDAPNVFDPSTELGRAYAQVDWPATSLGPIETWSASLRNSVRLMTRSRFSMWMGWGPDCVFFCNETYRHDTLGAKYPWALGRPLAEVWSEIWTDVRPRIDAVMGDGISTWDEGLLLFLERSGYAEETYHTFSYSPLTDDDGSIAGVFCVVSEDTGRVVSQRRITTLRDLGAGLAGANTEADVHRAAQTQLATDPYDLPFVSAYRVDGRTARRTWTVGIDTDHPAAPASIDLADQHGPWGPTPLDADPGPLVGLTGAFTDLPTGAWGEPPAFAQVMPLRQAGDTHVDGFLVVGLNPHRPLDEDYAGFLDLLGGQLSAATTRARAFEFERLRSAQIAELDRAKTTFFTNVSHELRTPLTLLLGPTEDLLTDPALTPTQRGGLEVVHRNAERLLKLVNTLLDFSRLESGRLQARFEPVDLAGYTRELAGMFDSAAARAGLSLEVACEASDGPFFVDREMWAKIVLNLISNALKATFTGGITVSLRTDDTGAHLDVTDTGIGIPAGELGQLFDRFHRVSGAALRTHEGSGIGLALVAELAELHGGEASVRSELGTGSTFTVSLPAGSGHLPSDAVVDRAVESAPATAFGAGFVSEVSRWIDATEPVEPVATEPASGPDDQRHLVLVADDNADMRDYICRLLSSEYRVVAAADGAIALELAGRLAPDLVLTDVMMPNLDGFGLLSALRTAPGTMHIPVVMLSARAGDEAAAEGIETGADDYLVKPFAARELLARVRANLELDRVRRLVTELERNREMLATAEELALIGSYEHDIVSGHVTGSAQFRRLLGVDARDLATNGYAAVMGLVHPDDRERFEAQVRHSVVTGDPLEAECRIVDGSGSIRYVWTTGAVERATDGTPRTIRGSVQDVTDRRRAEEASAAAAAARQAEVREREIAVQLQRGLLPSDDFDADHLEIAAYYQAGVEGTVVGGDWYDVIELDAGRTALVLGDVMGRGVQAATVMGQLRATVRAYARLDVAADLLLHLLDSAVREISDNTIVTCVYGVYDPADRSLTYANAGHLPPLLTVPGAGTTRLTSGGPPLGTGRSWAKPETVTLPVGSLLTMYTDGLVEDRTTVIDDGIDALAELITTSADRFESLPSHMVQTLRPDGTDDDIAVLVARVTERSALETLARSEFPADPDIARSARDFVVGHLRDWGVPAAKIYDAQLVISELATNAFRHGAAPIEVGLRRSGERLFLDVHDATSAPPHMRHPSATDRGGRGLLIISMLAQRRGTRQTVAGKSVWALIHVPETGVA